MKEKIQQNIDNPEMLEMLFRQDKTAFARDFNEATGGMDTALVQFWRIRLKGSRPARKAMTMKIGLTAVLIISAVAVLLARLPLLFWSMAPEDFYLRNVPLLIFAGLTAWFMLKNAIAGWRSILGLALPALALATLLNLLPKELNDTHILSILHAPVFMGFIFAMAFLGFDYRNPGKTSGLIRYCGELVIMSGLLAIAGAILSGMTIGMFAVIGMEISQLYLQNIAIPGVVVLPVIAAWLIDLYPGITDRIAPVIARVFTPLVLVSALVYLIALSVSGSRLSEDRELLLFFNIMLLCVMAIIVFSLSEAEQSAVRKLNIILLFLLAAVTLLIDLFALSAIMTRLSAGFTPNRTVVLVSNILILVNLLLVLPGLYRAGFRAKALAPVERIINRYLPVYFIYSTVVIFILPVIF